jgi:hypothetical protein
MKIFLDSGELDAPRGALARAVSKRAPGVQRAPDGARPSARTLTGVRLAHMSALCRVFARARRNHARRPRVSSFRPRAEQPRASTPGPKS